MWPNFVQHYRDPHLVSRIQKFFGVHIHYDDSNKEDCSPAVCEKNGLVNAKSKSARSELLSHENDKCTNKYGNENSCANNDDKSPPTPLQDRKPYTIQNYFWYYLFLFGTELGDEIFYLTFLPFWFWNVDRAVGRKIVLVWATVMTIGQALKDIIRWPRPSCPPVVRLQKKWSLEYGMPSTHAMVGISIPFSALFFTTNKYNYSFSTGFVAAVLWCTLICVSRIYLGMHTVLDIIAGLTLAILMIIPFIPLVNVLDHYIFTNSWILLTLVIISIATIIYYPRSDKWTPTRGDTTLVVSVAAGIYVGAWLNYNTGALLIPNEPPPYDITWPSYLMLGRTILRTIFGFSCVMSTKVICKSLTYKVTCAILRVNSTELMHSTNSLNNKNKILVDLLYKYITCFLIGFNIDYLLPNVFTAIGIERPTFYIE